MKLGGQLIGKSQEIDRLISSLAVDSSAIQEDLNWSPPHSVKQGLEEVADWYLAVKTKKFVAPQEMIL